MLFFLLLLLFCLVITVLNFWLLSMLNLAGLYFVFSLLISECTLLFNRADDKDHVEAQDSNTDDS
jgi:hypothetical protein